MHNKIDENIVIVNDRLNANNIIPRNQNIIINNNQFGNDNITPYNIQMMMKFYNIQMMMQYYSNQMMMQYYKQMMMNNIYYQKMRQNNYCMNFQNMNNQMMPNCNQMMPNSNQMMPNSNQMMPQFNNNLMMVSNNNQMLNKSNNNYNQNCFNNNNCNNLCFNGNNNFNCNNNIQLMNLIKEISQKIKYINFGNQKQMNDLMMQLSLKNIENTNYFSDPLYYIEEQKVIINFVVCNKINRKVIPKSITKFDLYTIAYPDYCILGINFVLIHKNKILERDESSIDNILDEDYIIIIEEKRYPDQSYYNSIVQMPGEKVNIKIKMTDKNQNMIIPKNITNSELIKIISEYFGLKDNSYYLRYQGHQLEDNNDINIMNDGIL